MVEILTDQFHGYQLVVSPERIKRPRVQDPGDCPFCPGREEQTPETRARHPETGAWQLRSFENKYPIFSPKDRPNSGYQEVLVESPDHTQKPDRFSVEQVKALLYFVRQRLLSVSRGEPSCHYVTWFKNEGKLAGATINHAHSQIVRLNFLPHDLEKKYRRVHRAVLSGMGCPFCKRHKQEEALLENREFKLIVNPTGCLPFEMQILPTKHVTHFEKMKAESLDALAPVLLGGLRALTAMKAGMDYNVILHNGLYHNNWNFHWHLTIIPRLTQFAGLELATGFNVMPIAPKESFAVLKKYINEVKRVI